MRHVLAVAVLCALSGASASAATLPPKEQVEGHGEYGTTKIELSAQFDFNNGIPKGHVTVQFGHQTVEGDVRGGCIWTSGNLGAVVAATRDPAMPYVGVLVEDNGNRDDRAAALPLSADAGEAMCLGVLPAALATVPLEKGNFRITER